MKCYNKPEVRRKGKGISVKNEGRKNREEVKRARQRERQMKKRLLLIVKGMVFAMLLLHIRMLDTQLKQVQVALKRIEIPQYEASQMIEEPAQEADYASSIGIVSVEKPIQRTWTETLLRLDSLGQSDPVIAQICQNTDLYPEKMLTALANNPEMADYVAGYLTGSGNMSGGLTQVEKEQAFPLLLQWDPRWGYRSYGSDSYIGVSGCGPTCLAMALYYLTGDETFTPDRIAEYALENGYYVEGTGTAWALIKDFPRFYGIRVTEPEVSEYALRRELDQGSILICAMGKGDFTTAGHFIVIYGYDQDGFRVNDPNCVARSRKRWTFHEISGQIKSVWALSGGTERTAEKIVDVYQ